MEFKIEELKKKNNCFEINEKTAKDLKNALKEVFFSLLSAVIIYFVIANEAIRHITFAFNELNVVILFLIMLFGTYTGYRLSELKRFAPLVKAKSNVKKQKGSKNV